MRKIWGILSEGVSVGGIVSSYAYAVYIYWLFGGSVLGLYYVPDISTPAAAMAEVGRFGSISVGYVWLQLLAVYTRPTTSMTSQGIDVISSVAPLFVLWSHMNEVKSGNLGSVAWQVITMSNTTLEEWVFSIGALATITDALFIMLIVLRLAFLANDFFKTH